MDTLCLTWSNTLFSFVSADSELMKELTLLFMVTACIVGRMGILQGCTWTCLGATLAGGPGPFTPTLRCLRSLQHVTDAADTFDAQRWLRSSSSSAARERVCLLQ